MPIRINQIRASARGQTCTIQSPWCNHDPDTTVLAHYSAPGCGTMGGKSDDSSAAYACSECHDHLDGRKNWDLVRQDMSCREMYENSKEWFWFRGMRRTWKQMLMDEVLTTGKSGSYRNGFDDGVNRRTALILEMVGNCTQRDPTLQKLQKAIEELE